MKNTTKAIIVVATLSLSIPAIAGGSGSQRPPGKTESAAIVVFFDYVASFF